MNPTNAMTGCDIQGCSRPPRSGKNPYCEMHYYRIRRTGTAGDATEQNPWVRKPLEQRFWGRVEVTGFCWNWTGARTERGGYGRVAYQGVMTSAHRVSYCLLVGPIPEGLQIDHLCRNRACVNPDHLEPVTPSENTRRSYQARGLSRTTNDKKAI